MDIRRETVLIVRKENQYVQTISAVTSGTIWTPHAYDAWRTRNAQKAIQQAKDVDGEVWLFNPVAGQLRPARLKETEEENETTL